MTATRLEGRSEKLNLSSNTEIIPDLTVLAKILKPDVLAFDVACVSSMALARPAEATASGRLDRPGSLRKFTASKLSEEDPGFFIESTALVVLPDLVGPRWT